MSGKVIGIIGSPRKDGDCANIVSRILESAEAAGNETEMYRSTRWREGRASHAWDARRPDRDA